MRAAPGTAVDQHARGHMFRDRERHHLRSADGRAETMLGQRRRGAGRNRCDGGVPACRCDQRIRQFIGHAIAGGRQRHADRGDLGAGERLLRGVLDRAGLVGRDDAARHDSAAFHHGKAGNHV